ncbi:exlusion protein FxsA [Vibrio cholerae]|nr:exlusion protein FxsA [Vibrio cholerae]TYA08557.1 exlusion protein FxsA [Vibrio cholerae]
MRFPCQEGLSTRGVSSPNEPRWLQLLCLSLVVMRCQPLRRALALFQCLML